MKILVTGGAGFIGYHTVNKLIREKFEVLILDNLNTGFRENINSKAKFIHMDIKNKKIHKLFEKEHFDYVIHLAAQTMVSASIHKPFFDCEENILGTVNLLEACRKNCVKKVIFASTAAVYGLTDLFPIYEDAITKPTSFYGLSKLTSENYLKLYNNVYGLNYIVLRYANVFGERQGHAGEAGVISIFFQKIVKNEPVIIFGDGRQTRDFIYAGDVAEANYQAILSEKNNCTYNISSNTEISINQLLQTMQNITGNKINKITNKPREGDVYRSCLNNVAAINLLKWHPKISFFSGLTKTYNSLKF